MEIDTNPEAYDTLEERLDGKLNPDNQETREGAEDVEDNGDIENLTFEELSTLTGRKFASKQDFAKHYKNLSSFVGKKKEVTPEEMPDVVNSLREELATLRKDNEVKDFLANNPTAKDDLELIEIYAQNKGMSLSEAYESRFANKTKSSQGANVINKNRVNPIQTQRDSNLYEMARQGDSQSQEDLVMARVYGKK